MTFHEPNPAVQPMGEEDAEFIEESPEEARARQDTGPDGDRPADWRLYTGEPVDGEAGTYRPQQMNVGRDNMEGGGEWPDPDTEARPPAPGAAEPDEQDRA